jgi:hypothetical protein
VSPYSRGSVDCGVAQSARWHKKGVRHGSIECDVAQWEAAWLNRVRRGSKDCDMALESRVRSGQKSAA